MKQVYGICFTDKGKALLRIENGKYQLTGGKSNMNDANFGETLKREF